MTEESFRWLIGIVVVATVLGVILSFLWYRLLAAIFGIKRKFDNWRAFLTENGVLTGIIERAFFAVAIGFGLQSITIAMVAWAGLKNETFWRPYSQGRDPDWNSVSVSLLATLGSMIIAIVAGKICSGDMFQDLIQTLRVYILG